MIETSTLVIVLRSCRAALRTDTLPHRLVHARVDTPVQMADPGAVQVPASTAKGMV
jgi:hypothetical protein